MLWFYDNKKCFMMIKMVRRIWFIVIIIIIIYYKQYKLLFPVFLLY